MDRRLRSWGIAAIAIALSLLISAATIAGATSTRSTTAVGKESTGKSEAVSETVGNLLVTTTLVNKRPNYFRALSGVSITVINVSPTNASDTSVVATRYTNEAGNAYFRLPPGVYVISSDLFGLGSNVTLALVSQTKRVKASWTLTRNAVDDAVVRIHDSWGFGRLLPGERIGVYYTGDIDAKPARVDILSRKDLFRGQSLDVVDFQSLDGRTSISLSPIQTLLLKSEQGVVQPLIAVFWLDWKVTDSI